MKPDTLGDPERIKCVFALSEAITELPENKRAYVSHFITIFNLRCKHLSKIKDAKFKRYCAHVMLNDYSDQLVKMQERFNDLKISYSDTLFTYFRNFIVTKIKIIINPR